LRLRAVVADPGGGAVFECVETGPAERPAELGRRAAEALLAAGARDVVAQVNPQALPLRGQVVVVTRPQGQSGPLVARLRALGADVVELPLIEFRALEFDPPDWGAYDWAVFTSANGVEFFFARCEPRRGPRLCAIGPATAAALRARGLEPDLVPAENVGEGVVAALREAGVEGARVLVARAEEARDVIPAELARLGARVDVLAVYRTVAPEGLEQRAREVFEAVRPQWVTLTSASTVRHLLRAVPRKLLEGVRIATIGPVTSAAAREAGLEVEAEANPYTAEALAAAMAERAARRG
jgi:uroporphyrinogen III methyltransferase/synthase